MEKEIEELIGSNGSKEAIEKENSFHSTLIKVASLIKQLLANKWKIIRTNLIIAVVTVLTLLFLVKPSFQSSVVILPEYGNKVAPSGGVSSLASLAGINIGDGTPTEIYENLIYSETVLEDIIYKKYNTEEFPYPVNLIEYFEIEADEDEDPAIAERLMFISAYKELTESRINTKIERTTRILTVSVKMPESKLAADVANSLVQSLDKYVRLKRKSYASEQRQYIEKRLEQINDSLRLAENRLKYFRDRNRIIIQSPTLMMEQNRLIRDMEMQQTIFVELTKQLELAKIDEIKDTPVVNYREEARESVLPAGPRRALLFIIVMFLSTIGVSGYYLFLPKFKYYKNLVTTAS